VGGDCNDSVAGSVVGKTIKLIGKGVEGVSSVKYYQGNEDERPPGILLIAWRRSEVLKPDSSYPETKDPLVCASCLVERL